MNTADSDAQIRFACMTRPGVLNTAFIYLQAIEGTGLGVRVMPLGAVHFGIAPWNLVSHLFLTTLGTRFINVVAVEPGTMLGERFQATQLVMTPQGVVDTTPRGAGFYEPPLALCGLFTVGIPNVAILSGDVMPEGKEIDSLKHYTAVLCPHEEGSLALDKLGIPTVTIPPDADQLSLLFSGMNPACI